MSDTTREIPNLTDRRLGNFQSLQQGREKGSSRSLEAFSTRVFPSCEDMNAFLGLQREEVREVPF
jgi:hypothetical protein